MLISVAEALERLESPNNLANRRSINDADTRKTIRMRLPEHPADTTAIVPLHNGGRRPGDKNVSEEDRANIGAEAQIKTLAEVAADNNVSLHHVHELSNGMHSTAQGQDPNLVNNINEKLDEPHQLALKKLTSTLLSIDESKLAKEKPKDLANMARALAGVAEHTAPIKHKGAEEDALAGCRLVVYAPTLKTENHYETVQVAAPVKILD